MTIQNFDRSNLRALQQEVLSALAPIATKYGIDIRPGRGTFGGSNATIKLELATRGKGGAVNTREAEAFKTLAPLFGLNPKHLGARVVIEGVDYKIIGLRPKASRRPVMLEDRNGKRLVCSPDLVTRLGVEVD